MPLPAALRETGSTSSRALALRRRRSTGRPTRGWAEMGFVVSLLVSLLAPLTTPCSLRAAEQLEVSFDGVVIPVDIKDLADWARSGGESNTELGIWLDLMEPARRAARRLVARGKAEITQQGRVVDPSTAKGPIRIRKVDRR